MDPFAIDLFCLIAAPFVGSFLSTIVVRWPLGEGWVQGRSRCRSCDADLGVRDLAPLLSWALTRGRCRHCRAKVSGLYPAIELGALVAAAMAVFVADGLQTVFGCLLGWGLLTLSVIDWRHQRIPDMISLPLIALGLLLAALTSISAIIDSFAGALAGGAGFAAVAYSFRKLRGHNGLGGGDIKLFAAAGAWVGWMGLPWVLLIASLIGLAASPFMSNGLEDRRFARISFGPFLAIGVWIVWLWQSGTIF